MAPGSGRHRSASNTIDRALFLRNKTLSAQYKRRFLADHDTRIQKQFELSLELFQAILQACDARNLLVTDAEARRKLLLDYVGHQTALLIHHRYTIPWSPPAYTGTKEVPYGTFDALYWQQTFGLRDQAHFDILVAAFDIDDDHLPLHDEVVPFADCFLAWLAFMHYPGRLCDVRVRMRVNWITSRISSAINGFATRIATDFGPGLEYNPGFFQDRARLEQAVEAIASKEPPLQRVFAFIDGTGFGILRPSGALQQNIHYSGMHKVQQGCCSQDIVGSDGSVGPRNPVPGRGGPVWRDSCGVGSLPWYVPDHRQSYTPDRHNVLIGASNDQQMLNASQLLDKLRAVLPLDVELLMYGDAGYTPQPGLLVAPFKRYSELTDEQKVPTRVLTPAASDEAIRRPSTLA